MVPPDQAVVAVTPWTSQASVASLGRLNPPSLGAPSRALRKASSWSDPLPDGAPKPGVHAHGGYGLDVDVFGKGQVLMSVLQTSW